MSRELLDWKPKPLSLDFLNRNRLALNRKKYASEQRFEKFLKKNKRLRRFKFMRNYPLANRFFGDFVFRQYKAVIELDGKSHEGKKDYDSKRDEFITQMGYRILRIPYWQKITITMVREFVLEHKPVVKPRKPRALILKKKKKLPPITREEINRLMKNYA